MKVSYFLVWILIAVTSSTVSGVCDHEKIIKCCDDKLNVKINKQISVELMQHLTYLHMAPIFDRYLHYYPTVAKYFRARSAKEIEHADYFIQYQYERGGTLDVEGQDDAVVLYTEGACKNVQTVRDSFKCAMEMETNVTSQLSQLLEDGSNMIVDDEVKKCAAAENFSVADSLRLTQPMLVTCPLSKGGEDTVTSDWRLCHCESIKSIAYVGFIELIAYDFLDRQVEGTKEFASHFMTLNKTRVDGGIGEFLFDSKLKQRMAKRKQKSKISRIVDGRSRKRRHY